ncbi:Phage portal protein, SPP1 Gp6-like [compost metagenome]
MSLEEIIRDNGYSSNWFVDYVDDARHQMRVYDIINKKEYLTGQHKINNRPPEMFNGKPFDPRRIVLNYGSRLIEYATSYLVGNQITYSGDPDVVAAIQGIYKNGYANLDYDVVKNVYAYGNAYEYPYIKDGKIRSKLIDPADSYPVVDDEGDYIAFVESYCINNITYWNVYYPDRVERYYNNGGCIRLRNTYNNASGLPVIYRNDNPIDNVFGRSDLDDYIGIIDNLEDLISKSTDGFYKHIVGIPVVKGQRLTSEDALPSEIVGGGLNLDSDADFKFENNEFSHDAFKTIYSHLMMSLMDVSGTPSVSMGKVDVSNLSEISLKLLFSTANMKANQTERFIREGLQERLGKFKMLLELQGKKFTDEQWDSITITFSYGMPTSESDIIDNLKTLREIGGISLESVLKHNPYVSDVATEMDKINGEGNGSKTE